jgi:uncharacterized protein (DUF2236 family)
MRWVSGLITAAMLPPRIRQEYRLPWDEGRQRQCERVASLTRAVRQVTPRVLAVFADARKTH